MTSHRVVLHADLNNFYASVACRLEPSLREVPVAVCGDPEMRHGIVLAKNMPAKRMGVSTGQPIWQARESCPNLRVVSPDFESYLRFSSVVRKIFARYTNRVQPFGMDEAWLDVSGPGVDMAAGERVANHLRHTVREETGLTMSVGVSDNRVFAKLGSDLKKPDGVTVVCEENRKTVLDPLPVSALLFIGPAMGGRLRQLGIDTVGQLAAMDAGVLKALFGKTGLMLNAFAHGDDTVGTIDPGQTSPVKSVGNSTTPARDVLTREDARIVLYGLSESVGTRLRKQHLAGHTVQLHVRDAALETCQRQKTLCFDTDCSFDIWSAAYELLCQGWKEGTPLRSLGVTVGGLSPSNQLLQLSFLPDQRSRQRQQLLERAVDEIRGRYGYEAVRRAVTLLDHRLGGGDIEREHVVKRESYF